jgi:hypothetical protein
MLRAGCVSEEALTRLVFIYLVFEINEGTSHALYEQMKLNVSGFLSTEHMDKGSTA